MSRDLDRPDLNEGHLHTSSTDHPVPVKAARSDSGQLEYPQQVSGGSDGGKHQRQQIRVIRMDEESQVPFPLFL